MYDFCWLKLQTFFALSLADSSYLETTTNTDYIWYWQDEGDIWKTFEFGPNVSDRVIIFASFAWVYMAFYYFYSNI